jgi:phosphoribosylamine--glycine ligase
VNILVIGSGGREHALCWRLARSGHTLTCAPGNPGIAELAECLAVKVTDIDGLCALATARSFDLVVVGPEAPLVAGLADRLRAAHIPTFGPGSAGARLEGSKITAKRFFARHGIPTAEFEVADAVEAAERAIDKLGDQVVVKLDGLAAGKGVVVCRSRDEAKQAARELLAPRRFGSAEAQLVIERRLAGREVSLLAITDGTRIEILPSTEDHKTIFDGDRGPNTGGMGAVCPSWVPESVIDRALREILVPTLVGLATDGLDYRGVLYAGLMVDEHLRPWLLEYNCRFGDPEAQPIMMRLHGDLGAVLRGAATGQLPIGELSWDPRTAVCVVVAAPGYPDSPHLGDLVGNLAAARSDATEVFHAGTAWQGEQLVSSGGRVVAVTGLGRDLSEARALTYAAVDQISLPGKQVRRDIGLRGRPAE